MEGKTLQDIFIKILRAELNEAELDPAVKEELTPDVVSALYSLSNHHDLTHVVASALYRNRVAAEEEIQTKYSRAELASVFRCEQIKYAYRQICGILDENAIPYIPLKGSVIRPYYPIESMRTSCDIDILVKEEDLDRAVDALTHKGFQYVTREYHDVSLYAPNRIHLELHFNIQENIDTLDAVLKDAWLHATPTAGYSYAFSKEYFLFHMFAHTAYHVLSGGCGIRPLMDIWIMEHKMGITYRQAEELLKKAGIYKFAVEITELVDICFSDKPSNPFSDALLSYIFSGGVYGTLKNKIAVQKETQKSTARYFIQRLFLPYRDMTVSFPILKKLPILLPFCWIIRIFEMIFTGKVGQSLSEVKMANNVSDYDVEAVKQMKDRLGL